MAEEGFRTQDVRLQTPLLGWRSALGRGWRHPMSHPGTYYLVPGFGWGFCGCGIVHSFLATFRFLPCAGEVQGPSLGRSRPDTDTPSSIESRPGGVTRSWGSPRAWGLPEEGTLSLKLPSCAPPHSYDERQGARGQWGTSWVEVPPQTLLLAAPPAPAPGWHQATSSATAT